MSLSPVEVIKAFNLIKDKYRRLYFDVYSVLIMHDWRPLDDYIGYDNFDFLVSSNMYDKYIFEHCLYSDVIESDYECFEVEIFNCKNIKPLDDYKCSYINCNQLVIKDLFDNYHKEKVNYEIEIDDLFLSNNWNKIKVYDVENEYDNGDVYDLDVYISPFIKLIFDDYKFINKDNIESLLFDNSNLIVHSNLWWGYEK